jgi:hypothetical protein
LQPVHSTTEKNEKKSGLIGPETCTGGDTCDDFRQFEATAFYFLEGHPNKVTPSNLELLALL